MRTFRLISGPAFAFALAVALVAACSSNDSGSSGNESPSPSACPPEPCTVGAICYQPAPTENCNGTWYCWSDQDWHCAPEESGGPGDATITFDTGYYPGDDAGSGDDSSQPEAAPADGAAPTDAGPG